jgi:hypothetical protein
MFMKIPLRSARREVGWMDDINKDASEHPGTEGHEVNDKAPEAAPDVPITTPTPTEPDWYVKIQRAKEAREAGIRLRKDKPSAVITQLSPT